MSEDPVHLTVDGRGRVSVGKLLPEGTEQLLAHREPDGSVVLEPAVVMSAAEANLRTKPELLARLEASAEEGAERIPFDPAERRARREQTTASDG